MIKDYGRKPRNNNDLLQYPWKQETKKQTIVKTLAQFSAVLAIGLFFGWALSCAVLGERISFFEVLTSII